MNIKLKEDIKPISYIKTNAANMLEYVNENKNPIIITQRGEARGVLLDVESYQEMIDALAMFNLLRVAEEALQTGATRQQDMVFEDLEKLLGELNG